MSTTEILSEQQIKAIDEHAEAFAMYLIHGQYKNNWGEMFYYYEFVAEYWSKCHDLNCSERETGIIGFLFQDRLNKYMNRFKDCEYL